MVSRLLLYFVISLDIVQSSHSFLLFLSLCRMWDLAFSCQDLETYNGCQCKFASMRFNDGEITCAKPGDPTPPACPTDCSVCQTCMVLLGCDDIYQDIQANSMNGFMGTVAVSSYAGGLLAALGLLYVYRRSTSSYSGGLQDEDDEEKLDDLSGDATPQHTSIYSLDSTELMIA
jgi:hypothetical protein